MNGPARSPDHDRLLADVATGVRRGDDAEVVAMARRDPEFATALADLERLQNELHSATRRMHADVRAAASEPEPFAGADRLVATRLAELRRPPGTRGHARRWLVAAALLVALGAWWTWRADGVPRGQWLSGRIVCVEPRGTVDAYAPFAWTYDVPSGGYFVVDVFDQDDLDVAVATSPKLEKATWRPDSPSLPDRIRWRVRAFDARGDELAFGWAEAAR